MDGSNPGWRWFRWRGASRRIAVSIGTLVALLGGCQVGPDFARPAPPGTATYILANATPNLAPGGGEPHQRLVVNQAIPAAWWELFRSPSLDNVVRQAIAGSPTIEAAKATLAQAQQLVLQTQGAYYPQLDAAAAAERQRGPAFGLGLLPSHTLPTYNLYSLGPSVSFTPDVFGLIARQVEQQEAQAENQAYELVAAQLTVTGNTVAEVLTIASVRLQIDAVDGIIADDETNLALVQQLFAAGKVNRTDLLLAEAELANDRTLLPPLRQQVAAAEDALAVLVGKSPAEWHPFAFALADFTLPAELPLSLPSALVRQRPDILAAEAQLHAHSAAIGVATAQMYPNFPLSASVGTAALTSNSLFEGSSVVWTLTSGLTAPIFHGGALMAQKQAAIEAFRASLATYRQTVLGGLGQVADLLRALGHDAELVEAERRAVDASEGALALERITYAAGKTRVLDLLSAERDYQQARVGYARARGQRYLDSAQLLVALGGGGWWGGRNPIASSAARSSPGNIP
ncbi:MAG: efflux transporter outer membrane subunit [Rhodospirillales bacterium]|nr:efflux transporter outer membrane subunit [Rhodospirillales bacterium]